MKASGRLKETRRVVPRPSTSSLVWRPIMVGRRKQGRENINVYSCGCRRDRGAAVCSNNAVAPIVEVDAAVIEGVRRYITPEVASEVLRQQRAILKERTAAQRGCFVPKPAGPSGDDMNAAKRPCPPEARTCGICLNERGAKRLLVAKPAEPRGGRHLRSEAEQLASPGRFAPV